MSTLLISDECFDAHDPGPSHPESPQRLAAVRAALTSLPENVRWGDVRDATVEELSRVHAPAYVESLARLDGESAELDADTRVSPGSWKASVRAAGAALSLVDALIDRKAENGFALVRPPGHHAERDRAMGFCLFNNVAVAAEHARDRGVARVAIVDWDVHHGNGTQHSFAERDDVLFISLHRFPFYPGTGAAEEQGHGAGQGFTLNVPLPAGMGDGDYGAAFDAIVLPALTRFRPELLLVSAGFDPHARDPLGGMAVSERGFGAMCSALRDVAANAGAPLGLVLEGGYDLTALGDSVRACIEVLAGQREPLHSAASAEGTRAIDQARAVAARHWQL